MKILLTIHHELTPNAGAPGVTWQLGQEYQKLGHQVQFYSFDNLPHQLPEKFGSVMFPEFVASKILALTRKQAVDVVDSSTGDAWIWTKIRRHQTSPTIVTRSHGLESIDHLERQEEVKRGQIQLSWKYPLYWGGFRLWEVETSIRNADLVLLCNQRELEYIVKQLGVNKERIRMVSNGITKEFLNLPFEPTPLTENSSIGIAQIGSYIPRKGIKYGASALNQILARHSQVKVSFLGTGCSEAQVYADFEPSVRDRIQVVPFYAHEQLPTLLRGHQIKLFPTLFEGFSVAVLEAMACGLTPVTTAISASEDLIRDGECAIVIPPRNCQVIEQTLERLITDRTELDRLRQQAQVTAQSYGWEQIARNNLNLYEVALDRRRQYQ
jgi:glycosyltransferase involved in cell wall biosynthesis